MASIGTGLDLQGNISRSDGKIPFTNLSMYEVSRRNSAAKLHTTQRTTLTLESPIRTCSVTLLTTLIFWFVAFLTDGRLFVCIDLSQSTLRESSWMRLGTAPFPKTIFTGVSYLR